MCELFGFSSARPVRAPTVLARFRLRGGGSADNPDGWGLAYLDSGRFRLYKEPAAGASSALFAKLGKSVRSELILAHVRKARYPRVNTFANTHPFLESCCGKEWVFAHNGLVPEIVALERANRSAVCRPAGDTDSEHAFCRLLDEIARHFETASAGEGRGWFEAVAGVSELIASSGKFNFLLSDGVNLIAYGHDRLHYTAPRPHDGPAAADNVQVMIATEPLTDEDSWRAFAPGELRIYRSGQLVAQVKTRPRAAAGSGGVWPAAR